MSLTPKDVKQDLEKCYPIFPTTCKLRVEHIGCGMEHGGPRNRRYYRYRISLVPAILPLRFEIPGYLQKSKQDPDDFINGILHIVAIKNPNTGKVEEWESTDISEMAYNNWYLYGRYMLHSASAGFIKNGVVYDEYHDKAYNIAITEFLNCLKEQYLNNTNVVSSDKMLGQLGEYASRYVYGHARTTDKALIYNIPEVKKIFNAINLLDDSVEDKSLLQDFIYGVMTDHIHLRGVLGTQYDTNLLVKWTPAVDPYSGKPGYFKYEDNSCERKSDEQE